ncbi:MAG TPA: hypothetical protein DD723_01220 [Candidatus Omnitrophica bacterium]|nr:MAG: hypothetical protein A2Z81_02205 [Omnitrophica WOR_2 bacterium GWA2_45_18]OGX19527.1 MAG: hypothetical protein A2Y04_00605 [Omnitrophica WOR_2 bacterium GWC2_45_7]HBR14151.1 hypothetical protein [Candidatus Omnitrophota bacterium]
MTKEKSKKAVGKNFMKSVAYGTGTLCRKVMGLGKVAKTKPWKEMVSVTQELCETVGEKAGDVFQKVEKTVKKSTKDMGESFKAGMESVETGHAESKTRKESQEKKEISSLSSPAKMVKKEAKGMIKGKAKGQVKKVGNKTTVKKEAPVNVDLEKEIEKMTEDVKDV